MKKLSTIVVSTLLFSSINLALAFSANDLPGSFKQTCHPCHINHRTNQLECTCYNRENQPVHTQTTISRNCTDYQNNDGRLECDAYAHHDYPHHHHDYPHHHHYYPHHHHYVSTFKKDISAGPIWNNDDAKSKCPGVCSGVTLSGYHRHPVWTGQWNTPAFSQNSVCECRFTRYR